MAAIYEYHPEAEEEYGEAVRCYLRQAPGPVAEGFTAALVEAPERWRVFEPPEMRRCAVKRYLYILCY